MSFVDAFENIILNAMLGASSSLLGSTLQIGLSTTTPADDGTNVTEPSGGSYARVSLTNDATNFDAASSGQKTNKVELAFPTATASWGTVTHWVLYESSVPKIWGVLDDGAGTPDPKTIGNTDTFKFPAGQLRIALD